jgi:hypothetical protein
MTSRLETPALAIKAQALVDNGLGDRAVGREVNRSPTWVRRNTRRKSIEKKPRVRSENEFYVTDKAALPSALVALKAA